MPSPIIEDTIPYQQSSGSGTSRQRQRWALAWRWHCKSAPIAEEQEEKKGLLLALAEGLDQIVTRQLRLTRLTRLTRQLRLTRLARPKDWRSERFLAE